MKIRLKYSNLIGGKWRQRKMSVVHGSRKFKICKQEVKSQNLKKILKIKFLNFLKWKDFFFFFNFLESLLF